MTLFYFGLFNPFHYFPLTTHTPFSIPFNTYPYLSTCTDVMFYDTVHALLFSFSLLFLPSLASVEQFYYSKHILYMSLYLILFTLVYIFILWIYLLHTRVNIIDLFIWLFSFLHFVMLAWVLSILLGFSKN
jgi:hypothetical protein